MPSIYVLIVLTKMPGSILHQNSYFGERYVSDDFHFSIFSDILSGSVGILNNYNLCHIKTIEWKNEIITSPTAKYRFEYKFHEPERDCTPCHESCTKGCWGPGPQNCQKFSKVSCSPQCHQGRCFGPKPRECCHLFCAGGCTGPKQSDCLVRTYQQSYVR